MFWLIIIPVLFIVIGIIFVCVGIFSKGKKVIDYELKDDLVFGKLTREHTSAFADKIRGAVRPSLCSIKDMSEIYAEEKDIIYP